MARAIIIKRISRRTGVIGIPRRTQGDGIRRLAPGESPSRVARQVLATVKAKTAKDGHDRQIEYVDIKTLKSGRHKITSKVLFRVYKSSSDKQVHVYAGKAHQGSREGVEVKELKTAKKTLAGILKA